ncbi:hypothetical protein DIKCMJMK_00642 [Shewanella oneidensis]|nr:hypothetical protein [Shewanella oneidensis]
MAQGCVSDQFEEDENLFKSSHHLKQIHRLDVLTPSTGGPIRWLSRRSEVITMHEVLTSPQLAQFKDGDALLELPYNLGKVHSFTIDTL